MRQNVLEFYEKWVQFHIISIRPVYMFSIVRLIFPMEILPHTASKCDNEEIGIVSNSTWEETKRPTPPPMQPMHSGGMIKREPWRSDLWLRFLS